MTGYSQAGQDEWVHSLHPEPGFFVDVGAYDGVEHSNTLALEERGWVGICIEPGPAGLQLARNRPMSIPIHMAASDQRGALTMHGDTVLPDGNGNLVPCDTLASILAVNGAPDVIDYLSVDVEGHEIEVLAGMDFDRWSVRLITIEHNLYRDGPTHKEAIHSFLTGCGFVRVVEDVVAPGYGPFEDWYRHRGEG